MTLARTHLLLALVFCPRQKNQPRRALEIAVPVLDEVYDVLGLVR
jgi:hypothetical protein